MFCVITGAPTLVHNKQHGCYALHCLATELLKMQTELNMADIAADLQSIAQKGHKGHVPSTTTVVCRLPPELLKMRTG